MEVRGAHSPSASCGSLGSGLQSSDCSEMSVDLSVRTWMLGLWTWRVTSTARTGDHLSLRMSRQIAPWEVSSAPGRSSLTLADETLGSDGQLAPCL